MQRNHFQPPLFGNVLTVLLALPIVVGCEESSGRVDRATDDADRYRVAEESGGDERPPAVRIRESQTTDATIRFRAPEEVPTGQVASLHNSRPIATPVPADVTSTFEAEGSPQRASFQSRPSRAVQEARQTAAVQADIGPQLRQADELCRRGAAAVTKGAWFTARAEFMHAARLIAAAFDTRDGLTRRQAALETGLTALREAEEFLRSTRDAASTTSIEVTARGHHTLGRLGGLPANASAATAHEEYCRFAERQLVEALTGSDSASVALHGLGKIHAASSATIVDARAKARCYYTAALGVAPSNFLASNDLAVLLAEDGRFEQARDVLHAGLRQSSQPAMWKNLAAVHDRMGQANLAQHARAEATAVERKGAAAPGTVLPTHNVAWLDPRGFAATSRPSEDAQLPPPATSQPVPQVAGAAPANVRPTAPANPPRPVLQSVRRNGNSALQY